MSRVAKEAIGLMTISVVLYLVLTNSAGFARNVRATGRSFAEITKTLQGR